MEKAIITFANGEQIKLTEGQKLYPIVELVGGKETLSSKGAMIDLDPHPTNGLIPPIADLICSSKLFGLSDNARKVYTTSSIVCVELV